MPTVMRDLNLQLSLLLLSAGEGIVITYFDFLNETLTSAHEASVLFTEYVFCTDNLQSTSVLPVAIHDNRWTLNGVTK